MIAIQVARIIADFSLFLDQTDEDILENRAAVKMMELLGYHLENLDKGFLRELVDAFAVIAAEYKGEAQAMVRDIPYDYYLEEILAADDPVRMAELDAVRAARD